MKHSVDAVKENYFHNFFSRLVMNLMTINIVSCLVLFPAVIWDLSLTSPEEEAASKMASTAAASVALPTNNLNTSEAVLDSIGTTAAAASSYTLSPSMFVCIWSTMSSSIVAHSSLLAMLTVGKF